MPFRDWIDVAFIKICTQHTCASIVAMGSFKLTAWAANVLLDDERLRFVVHGIEQLVLVAALLWLVYKVGVLLWKHRVGPDERMLTFVA